MSQSPPSSLPPLSASPPSALPPSVLPPSVSPPSASPQSASPQSALPSAPRSIAALPSPKTQRRSTRSTASLDRDNLASSPEKSLEPMGKARKITAAAQNSNRNVGVAPPPKKPNGKAPDGKAPDGKVPDGKAVNTNNIVSQAQAQVEEDLSSRPRPRPSAVFQPPAITAKAPKKLTKPAQQSSRTQKDASTTLEQPTGTKRPRAKAQTQPCSDDEALEDPRKRKQQHAGPVKKSKATHSQPQLIYDEESEEEVDPEGSKNDEEVDEGNLDECEDDLENTEYVLEEENEDEDAEVDEDEEVDELYIDKNTRRIKNPKKGASLLITAIGPQELEQRKSVHKLKQENLGPIRGYGSTQLRIDYGISKEVWDSMVVSLIIMMIHEDLFPSTNDYNREQRLRGIIVDHNLDSLSDKDDRIYRLLRHEMTLNRSHMREKILDNIEKVFSDLTFPTLSKSSKPWKVYGSVIQHLAKDKEFIYKVENDGSLGRKFHSDYIVNTIGLLFTGNGARLPYVMKDDATITVPLLGTVCTLLEYFVQDFPKNEAFKVGTWSIAYQEWIQQIKVADGRKKIDWNFLMVESQTRFSDAELVKPGGLEFEELPDTLNRKSGTWAARNLEGDKQSNKPSDKQNDTLSNISGNNRDQNQSDDNQNCDQDVGNQVA